MQSLLVTVSAVHTWGASLTQTRWSEGHRDRGLLLDPWLLASHCAFHLVASAELYGIVYEQSASQRCIGELCTPALGLGNRVCWRIGPLNFLHTRPLGMRTLGELIEQEL